MARASKRAPLDIAHAEAMRKKGHKRSGSDDKHGRNRRKCADYRRRVGKPNGPGQPGQHIH